MRLLGVCTALTYIQAQVLGDRILLVHVSELVSVAVQEEIQTDAAVNPASLCCREVFVFC